MLGITERFRFFTHMSVSYKSMEPVSCDVSQASVVRTLVFTIVGLIMSLGIYIFTTKWCCIKSNEPGKETKNVSLWYKLRKLTSLLLVFALRLPLYTE